MPRLSFCNKRYASVMSELLLTETVKNESDSGLDTSDLDSQFSEAVANWFVVLRFLYRLKLALRPEFVFDDTTFKRRQLDEYASVRKMLNKRWLVNTLLRKDSPNPDEQTRPLELLAGGVEDTMVFCGNGEEASCNSSYVEAAWAPNFLNCFVYDPAEGELLDESLIHGVENGKTFIFMTGSHFLASRYSKKRPWIISGFQNTFGATAGSDGIQMSVIPPHRSPGSDYSGIDVSTGMATAIGISSRSYKRLGRPYGKCATVNTENELLAKQIRKDRGISAKKGAREMQSAYSLVNCRESCLQRHIWQDCGCLLDSLKTPFVNASLLCGRHVDPIAGKCHDNDTMLSDECWPSLKRLLTNLKCVGHVYDKIHLEESHGETKCDCPVPCRSIDYKLSASSSLWPSPGPETDAAYQAIVQRIVVPYFERINSSLAREAVKYFSNFDNREEIMKNFARVTLYVKSLTVEHVEQVPAYPGLNLLSDIGESRLSVFSCF